MPFLRHSAICLSFALGAYALCACLGAASIAADNADVQRARKLRARQTSGEPLTTEEKTFLKQMRETLTAGSTGEKSGTTPRSGRSAPGGAGPVARPYAGDAGYYVARDGNDANPGSLAAPWATIAHALTRLCPGDTLHLRAGTHYALGLTTDILGTADHPITIQSYPGEQAVLDGALSHFLELNKQEWILHNAAIDEYRSARTFPGNYVRVWLTDERMQIFRYKRSEDMESTHYGPIKGATPIYFGPGAQLRDDGHVYIRLSPNPNDQFDVNQRPIPPVPADVNPNHNRMAVSVSAAIGGNVIFNAVVRHVVFQNLTVGHAKTLFDLKPGSHHLAFRNSTFLYGTYGINCRSQVTDLNIVNNTFDNQVPYFLYWTDVKNEAREVAEGYPDFQSLAVAGFSSNTKLHQNIFQNGFDGFQAADGVNISVISNQFLDLHDDSMNLLTGTSGEVAHNLMWHVNSGIAILGSSGWPGDMFIHHNVIDTTALRRGGRAGNYRAEVWLVWNTDTPFSKHGGGNRAAWWKLYNNTIIARAVSYGTPMNPFSLDANSHFFAVNNIFYAVDNRLIYRDHLIASGATYDGNIVWQVSPGGSMFRSFGDGDTYSSLAAFHTKKTAWEVHGQQTDPGFDRAEINQPDYRYPAVLKRYYPTNPAVGSVGFSYEAVQWPETAGVNYTGAFPVKDH